MSDDRYNDWDASYVVGALSADERREYERHLAECAACREQVAELAGMPGLLAAVPAAQAVAADPLAGDVAGGGGVVRALPVEPRMPSESLPRLLAAARKERRRSRARVAGLVTVAAGLAASLALVLPGWMGNPPTAPTSSIPQAAPAATPAATVALEQVVASPLTADVTLLDHPWGTRIDSRCAYAGTPYASGAQSYEMYVTDQQGTQSKIATWLAGPGSTVEVAGTTWLRVRDIAAVDIRSASTGEVLLKSQLNVG